MSEGGFKTTSLKNASFAGCYCSVTREQFVNKCVLSNISSRRTHLAGNLKMGTICFFAILLLFCRLSLAEESISRNIDCGKVNELVKSVS